MCNPRQIQVQAARRIAEAFDQEVRRQVSLRGLAVGRAVVRETLTGSIGRPVLACLDAVLDGREGWTATEDGYRYDLSGGHVVFRTGSGELEIVAELSAEVAAVGESATVVRTAIDEDVTASAVGRYYDDDWGGFTERRARRTAAEEAERALEAAAEARIAEARAAAAAGVDAEVLADAERRARAELDRLTGDRREQLERAAADRLGEIGERARTVFNQALAEAYRDAILAYAGSRRAEGVRTSRSGGVLTVQFEMEA